MSSLVLLRGGGDLASGVALRLFRAGIRFLITELAQPLLVRRTVSFGAAVFEGALTVEGVRAQRAEDWSAAEAIWQEGQIPVLVDPHLERVEGVRPLVLIDARMTKRPPETGMKAAKLVVGLGPGFAAGENCHAVVETQRGHDLGRVIWEGAARADTGVPGSIAKVGVDRVLRAPAAGRVAGHIEIGGRVKEGGLIARVGEVEVRAPFDGVLRGLIHPSVQVEEGMKIGDLDPRGDPDFVRLVSDKALAIGGGVLEAVLSRPEIRERLWA